MSSLPAPVALAGGAPVPRPRQEASGRRERPDHSQADVGVSLGLTGVSQSRDPGGGAPKWAGPPLLTAAGGGCVRSLEAPRLVRVTLCSHDEFSSLSLSFPICHVDVMRALQRADGGRGASGSFS